MTKARDLANASTALSAVSATELGYVDGVTSAIQTQMDTKLASSTAATTYQAINANVSTTELGYLDGVTSAIQTQLDAKTAKSTLTTTGDIYYASAANTPARLGIGSSAQVLTVASGVPSWATPAAGGKVLQVVTAVADGSTYSQSSTYTDVVGATCSITPSSTSSKVLILGFLPNIDYRNSTSAELDLQLTNGSNTQITMAAEGYGIPTSNVRINTSITLNWLHSPATTSSYTYKFRMRSKNAVNGVYVNNGSGTYMSIVLMEIGA
jgi:hypothetical protein